MNRKQWQEIEAAASLLELGERATLAEIKQAYRRLSKQYHPDFSKGKEGDNTERMYRITAAYEILMRYCADYRFPLSTPADNDPDLYDPDDWWMERFGESTFWKKF